jgi:CCR4-NOT transcription complex subunit 2
MPKDELQECAAVELFARNWRYHKELKVWLTKDPSSPDHLYTKSQNAEKGPYIFFDTNLWCKTSHDFVLFYDSLDDRSGKSGGARQEKDTK